MIDETKARVLDRRGFLKGSALFAALAGISVAAPALAQESQKPAPEGDHPADKTEQPPAPKKKPLLDKDGREYRVCDMCGGNMYKQENTWTCEQCGYSYQE
jgi:anaerobic selenocysteine-containing dehydrogenase